MASATSVPCGRVTNWGTAVGTAIAECVVVGICGKGCLTEFITLGSLSVVACDNLSRSSALGRSNFQLL